MNKNLNNDKLDDEFLKAKEEIGESEFNLRYRKIFDVPCLDFVNSLVINLPESCYANCEYCIDKNLRKNRINNQEFLSICEKVLKEFPDLKMVAITGGTLNPNDFNTLTKMIKSYFPNIYINWNTNGVMLDDRFAESIKRINHINLHRNSANEEKNIEVFKTKKSILTIEQAKKLFKDKLCLRITIDENFNIDDYLKFNVLLYLNRMLPGNDKTDKKYNETLEKLNITDNSDIRRRNVYLSAKYKNIPVRICVGDKMATHVPNRKPTFLNVVIIYRSGIVCGSWFEDDKVLYNPMKMKEQENKEIIDERTF